MPAPTITARLHADGFAIARGVVDEPALSDIRTELQSSAPSGAARQRNGSTYAIRDPLSASNAARTAATQGPLAELARAILGPGARPVRSIYFDKSPEANWKVPWHQDLTIAVSRRVETPGFGPWSERDGCVQVRPPRAVLEHIVTLRLNLDQCSEEDGPLLVAPRTHTGGIIAERQADSATLDAIAVACTGNAGDVVLMKPLTMHASRESRRPSHRRVLHVEYAAMNLPGELTWASDQPA